MLLVLSPAKSLDFATPPPRHAVTQPQFVTQSTELMRLLRQYTAADLSGLMHISNALATLNVERNQEWQPVFDAPHAKPAIHAFSGDVYAGFDAARLTAQQLQYAQKTLRILSGLYGVLRPLDMIRPYRLEMGSKLVNDAGKNLYAFWGAQLAHHLNDELKKHKSKFIVNLASDEYFKALPLSALAHPVIQPMFYEAQDKIVSFYAKRARGMMARYVVQHRIDSPDGLQNFNEAGYRFAGQRVAHNGVQQLLFRRAMLA